LLLPVWSGEQKLEQVFRPAQPGEAPELVAEGFRVDVELSGEVDGKLVKWTEHRWLVRSVAFAQAQETALEARVAKAEAGIASLNERRQGKKRLSLEQAEAEAQRIVDAHGVAALVGWDVLPVVHERQVRGYNGQPGRVEREENYQASAWRFEEELTQKRRELGWQVYADNGERLGLNEVVWVYRGQNGIEKGWSRLKGKPLSLTPMYLSDEGRMAGLVLLLSLALRVLQLTEWQAREELARGKEVLRGLYPGQPGRKTATPSAELLLRAFRGVSLVVVESGGRLTRQITALSPLQRRLLQLWNLQPDLFQLLESHSSKPTPVLSER
jgi:transposase